jgi:adenylate cyclase
VTDGTLWGAGPGPDAAPPDAATPDAVTPDLGSPRIETDMAAPTQVTASAGTALVVDDSAVNRKLLGQLLAGIGVRAVEAGDGVAALALLRGDGGPGGAVDVVLLDVMMPELDGYETLAAIKSDPALRHLPVIMISGVDELDSVVRCIEMGATDYLPKPFDAAVLRARVNASLAAKRLHDLQAEYVARLAALNETVERQKQELTRFLSPQVAALVSSAEGEQLLAGHRRQITVAFADLRGFTAFAQQAEPEDLLGVLAEYHAMMGRQIVEHAGTLEHFAGDGMMVFFNDPVPQPDHVERAVRMAVAMRERFEELARGWGKRGFELSLGVGIASGYATLGRIGFEGRYDYGAIGNVVILASRLSSEARGGQILLGPRAHAGVEELVDVEPVGDLQLKGISRPVSAVNVVAVRSAEAVPG